MNSASLASVRPVSRRSLSLVALVGAACLLVGLPASSARAAVVHCGDTLTRSTVVGNDLTCPDGPAAADGLIIGADGIVVNLAGHTISAATPSDSTGHIGIAFNGHARVKLRNGTVKGFTEGIGVLVDGDDNALDRINTSDNAVGVRIFEGDRNRITNSRQDHNGTGVRVDGFCCFYPPPAGKGRNTITYDRATGNGIGIALDSYGSANSVSHSTLSGNAWAGIELFGESGDSFTYNTLASNGFAGLSVLQSENIAMSANTASRNTVGFSFRDCPDAPDFPCTSGAVIRNNQALRNTYGFDAGFLFNGVFRANRAQVNSAAGFRLRGTSGVTLVDNIAGSVRTESGATDGNGSGIDVGDGDDGRGGVFGSSGTVLVGNSANSNKGGPDGPGDGIIIRQSRGQVGSDATLTGNTTNRNAADGILVEDSSANSVTLSSNAAARNRRYGIEVLLHDPASINDGGGNRAFGNLLGQCIGVACS